MGLKSEIVAVLFDADGVIQRVSDWPGAITGAVGLKTPDAFEAFMTEVFEMETPCLTGAADFAEALPPVLKRWSSACDVRGFFDAWHRIDVDRGVLDLIADLRRRGLYCALASNQEHHRARYMSDRLAYAQAFDAEFYSCRLGHAKPSVRYFQAILEAAGLDPSTVLFIDDRAENVEAARIAGLHAAQFELGEMGMGADPMRTLLASFGVLDPVEIVDRAT